MAFTLPGPAGEGWWWEEDVGTWRLMSGPNRRKGAVPPPAARDAGARRGAVQRDEASRTEGEAEVHPRAGQDDREQDPQGPRLQPPPVPHVRSLGRQESRQAVRNGRYSVSIRGGSATPTDDQL